MKTILSIILVLVAGAIAAQTTVNKTIPVKSGQQARFNFDYPNMIRISTWNKNEISIQGKVSINGGESDDAFVLDIDADGSTIYVKNEIKNMDDLPHRITIVNDGVKTVFKNEAEWRKYKKEHGKGSYQMMNQGLDIEIELDINVPVNMQTSVVCVYGMVEVKDFKGPLRVEATYGGVDASLTEGTIGELIAETNYGHIYSDLNVKFDNDRFKDEDFHMYVSARPGNGPTYRFESPYGNVYLRRAGKN